MSIPDDLLRFQSFGVECPVDTEPDIEHRRPQKQVMLKGKLALMKMSRGITDFVSDCVEKGGHVATDFNSGLSSALSSQMDLVICAITGLSSIYIYIYIYIHICIISLIWMGFRENCRRSRALLVPATNHYPV
jgi:hypothetical protein